MSSPRVEHFGRDSHLTVESESGKGLRGSVICDQGGVTLGSEIGGQTW